jgi:translocation and assembly module TamB
MRHGRFVLATRPFDAPPTAGRTLLTYERGRVQAQVRLLPDRVAFTDVIVESEHSRLGGEVTLFYDPSRGLQVRTEGEVDLSDFGHIAQLPWAGHGSVSITVDGPYSHVKIGSTLSLQDMAFWGFNLGVVQGKVTYADHVLGFPSVSGQKGRTQYFGNATLTFGRSLHARADVQVPRGRTEDLVDLIAGLHPNISVLQGVLQGEATGWLEIDSPVSELEGLVALEFKDTTYYGRRMGNGAGRIRFDDGQALVLERTVLEGPLGRTWAEGTFFFDGPEDGKLGLPLRRREPLPGGDGGAGGSGTAGGEGLARAGGPGGWQHGRAGDDGAPVGPTGDVRRPRPGQHGPGSPHGGARAAAGGTALA